MISVLLLSILDKPIGDGVGFFSIIFLGFASFLGKVSSKTAIISSFTIGVVFYLAGY